MIYVLWLRNNQIVLRKPSSLFYDEYLSENLINLIKNSIVGF
jgi:hypothetical protein